jgi:hypothetical protein
VGSPRPSSLIAAAVVVIVTGSAAAAAVACSTYSEAPIDPVPDAASGGDGSTNPDSSSPQPTWLPTEGAYRYRVDGRQELRAFQLNPLTRDEGPIAPAEIRREPGTDCWKLRICLVGGKCEDAPTGGYSEVSLSFCVDAGRLELRRAVERSRWQLWNGDYRNAVSDMTCDPGQATYAQRDLSMTSWSHVCQGAVDTQYRFASSGPYRFIGQESMMVGGVSVPAFRFSEERVVANTTSGAPAGKQIGEYWFAANGMPLRLRRGVELETDFGIGKVTVIQSSKLPPPDPAKIEMNDCILDSLEPSVLPVIDASTPGGG